MTKPASMSGTRQNAGRAELWSLLGFMGAMTLLLFVVFAAPSSDHPLRATLLIVGYAAEAVGLGMAMRGLYKTWVANAPGRPLLPALAQLRARLRRPQAITVHPSGIASGAALGDITVTGTATGKAGPLSLEEQLAELRDDVTQLRSAVRDAAQAFAEERSGRQEDVASVRRDMTDRDAQVEALAVRLTVDGIPLAVKGPGLTLTGLVVQALGQGLP
jgi:hypothetical protein